MVSEILGGVSALITILEKTVRWFRRKPEEMEVDREIWDEMGLSRYLEKGERVLWANPENLPKLLPFGDYERIYFTDCNGKYRVLVGMPRGQIPLKTKFEPNEIEARKAERLRKAREGSTR